MPRSHGRLFLAFLLLGACGKKEDTGATVTPGLAPQPGETDLAQPPAAAEPEVAEATHPYFQQDAPCGRVEVTVHPQGQEPRRYDLVATDGKLTQADDAWSMSGTLGIYHRDTCRIVLTFKAPDGNVLKSVEAMVPNGETQTIAGTWGDGMAQILMTPAAARDE